MNNVNQLNNRESTLIAMHEPELFTWKKWELSLSEEEEILLQYYYI